MREGGRLREGERYIGRVSSVLAIACVHYTDPADDPVPIPLGVGTLYPVTINISIQNIIIAQLW